MASMLGFQSASHHWSAKIGIPRCLVHESPDSFFREVSGIGHDAPRYSESGLYGLGQSRVDKM